MPELSIIIPVADDAQAFEDTLVSVLENRPDDCEVIVVRDERYDDPYALADEVKFVQARREAGLVERFSVGVGASRAELVHLVSGRARVTDRWTATALTHFHHPRVAAVVPIVVDDANPKRGVAAGAALLAGGHRRLRRSLPRKTNSAHETDLAATLVAAFFRKSAFQLVGGLDVAVGDALADVDLAARLRHAGYLSVIEPEARLTHVGPLPASVVGEPDPRCEERLFWRSAPTFGWGRALWQHPVSVAGRLLTRPWQVVGQLAGRAAVLSEIRQLREHHRRLAGIRGLASAMGEAATDEQDAGDSPRVERIKEPAVIAIDSHRDHSRPTTQQGRRRSRAA